MGYYGSRHNPIFGNSTTDETPSSATWYGEKHYRNLTINSGVVIQSGITTYGPLIIRCSGTLTVGGTLHADGKSMLWGDRFDLGHSGGTEWGPFQGYGVCGGYHGNISNYQDSWSGYLPAIPIPGGGGGEYQAMLVPGFYGDYYQHGIYSNYQVTAGADGDSILKPGKDPADFVDLMGGMLAIGCGGGGGWNDGCGGDGGGAVLVFAKRVVVLSGGIIRANGADGELPGDPDTEKGGGGGGGGLVGIVCDRYENNGTVESRGGFGAVCFVSGGNGMDGVVKILEAA